MLDFMMLAKKMSKGESLKVNIVISRKNLEAKKVKICCCQLFATKKLIAIYGAIVRGSVFKIVFRF